MEIIHRICCGIDVHAKTVVVCLIKNGKKQIRTYSTMTDDLVSLSDWLVLEGCKHVAIERIAQRSSGSIRTQGRHKSQFDRRELRSIQRIVR